MRKALFGTLALLLAYLLISYLLAPPYQRVFERYGLHHKSIRQLQKILVSESAPIPRKLAALDALGTNSRLGRTSRSYLSRLETISSFFEKLKYDSQKPIDRQSLKDFQWIFLRSPDVATEKDVLLVGVIDNLSAICESAAYDGYETVERECLQLLESIEPEKDSPVYEYWNEICSRRRH